MHGAVMGVFKNQIDWLPLSDGSVRSTQGRTLAVMQVSGGSQSFSAVNTLRLLGRWMRMVTIPNQSSVPKVYEQFDEAGRMLASPPYDRVVEVLKNWSASTGSCVTAPIIWSTATASAKRRSSCPKSFELRRRCWNSVQFAEFRDKADID